MNTACMRIREDKNSSREEERVLVDPFGLWDDELCLRDGFKESRELVIAACCLDSKKVEGICIKCGRYAGPRVPSSIHSALSEFQKTDHHETETRSYRREDIRVQEAVPAS